VALVKGFGIRTPEEAYTPLETAYVKSQR